MSITFTCEKCGKEYRVQNRRAGKKVRCKICGQPMEVPNPGNVLRHAPREKPFELAFGDEANIEAISNHIEQHIGPIQNVLHELISDLVHIDLHVVAPTEERPYYTLVTSGMSDLPMTVPPGAEGLAYAELLITLPGDWQLGQEAFEDERNYWPIRWLKMLARMPHEYETWLGFGHTVPNGDPPLPFAEGTRLCGWMILPPVLPPSAFWTLDIEQGRSIQFYSLVALYPEEIDYKLEHGADALLDRFEAHQVTELLDLNRDSVCPQK